MKILVQVGILFGLTWISQCIEAILPFSFPASVISLLLLLVLLIIRVIRVEHIREKSDFLLGNLAFFFVPVAASIMNYFDLIQNYLAAFVTIVVVSTALTFGVTAWVVQLASRWMEKGEKK